MQRSGCSLALINMASGYEASGTDLQTSLAPVRRLTTLCHQGNLPFALAVGFGANGETTATVDQKLDFLRETRPAFATLRVATRVLPHTPLAQQAMAEGLIQTPADLIQPVFYLAEAVRDGLVARLSQAAATEPRWHLM
jgi:hypothetical protein